MLAPEWKYFADYLHRAIPEPPNHRSRNRELLDREENCIEIIFTNKYSFMSDGMTSYFLLDENNKYSLKGQTIYSRNGSYQVAKIFPCLNVLNPCQVKLQLLQP